jgi:probable phosphoglycerate mutase
MSFPQPTRILAIRHGETAWNVDTRIQGHLDIPLNDTGRHQARRLAAALADEPLQAIYSSDLSRAHQTATALADAVGLPVHAVPGLRERAFGHFEGRTFREIEAQWPDQALRWRRRDPDFCPAGGESLTSFYARVIDQAQALAAAHPGETIALVAHGGVLDCLYRVATRVDLQAPRTWELANASINRLLHTPEGFTLVGWADTQHLQDLALDEFADGAR